MKNQSHKMLSYGILFFIIATVIVMHPTGEINAQQPISVKISKWFSNSQVIFPFIKTEKIYRLAINGSIQLHKDNSLIRVILVGDDFHEYLVYEAYPLTVDNTSVNIINECEETCIIEGIIPHSLKIELIDASLQIDEMALTDYQPSMTMEIAEAQKQIKEDRDAYKIKKLNENIEKKGLKWVAGETSISILSYEEKMKLFGGDMIPNLQGFEFYKSGIFEIKTGDTSSSLPNDEGASSDVGSSLIEHFDWRNRHGANNPGSPYYDGDPTGSGWITSITSQGCADCWAHSAVGATEALANLYFNQHLDVNFGLNLSIQDVVSCSGAGSCSGGGPGGALNYIANTGVVDEDCFPYAGSDEPCDDKCHDPDEIIRINGQDGINPLDGEENLKRNLIDHGPLNFGIDSWWHSMVLVGFDKDTADEETIWILKNSWGTGWGENGYGSLKVALSDMYLMHVLTPPVTSDISSFETVCLDSDGDGYYNWGISDTKPDTCPAHSSDEKDCDDWNSTLGPFDSDGRCIELTKTKAEIIGTWASGIWYRDVAKSKWTKMYPNKPPGDIAAGKFTGDDKADVASIWSSGLWYQNGDSRGWTQVSPAAPDRITAGDITGDGRDEIIGCGGAWSSGIWSRDVAKSKWTKINPNTPIGAITAGDFNGDGRADVASTWPTGLYWKDVAAGRGYRVSNSNPYRLTAGDITGDGVDEIISTWPSGFWYRDVAKSKWTKMNSYLNTKDIAAGDFTGDGKADVASNWISGLWYQNAATRGWTKVTSTAPYELTAGDVTGN